MPTKPLTDGEPIYEDHPVSFDSQNLGHSVAADVRRPLYWDLFGGAFGHTYGHHSVWQMWSPKHTPKNFPLMPWFEAINQPGAAQMQYARALLESRQPDPLHESTFRGTGGSGHQDRRHRLEVSARHHPRTRGEGREERPAAQSRR